MFVFGILVFLAGLFCVTMLAANFKFPLAMMAIYDVPTTFCFIVVIASVVIATGGFKTFIMAINALLSKKYYISAADKEKSVRLFKLLGKSVIYGSVIFTVLPIILILFDLSDLTTIGPKVSIALAAIFQGSIINLIFINPAINILETRYNTEEKTVISEKQVIDKLLELCYKQGISPEDILDAEEIHFKSHKQ